MTTADSGSPLQGPSGFRLETGAISRRRFGIRWVLALLGVGLAALLMWSVTLTARSPKTAPVSSPIATEAAPAAQPAITWSADSIDIILSPGESASRSLTFTSSTELRNVRLEAVAALVPFLTITPTTFSRVPANSPQSVTVNFAISAAAVLGDYDGTIRVRSGVTTLPRTLKLLINVWNVFSSPLSDFPVAMHFPPDWRAELTSADQGGPYLLLKEPGDDIGNATLTIGVFNGSAEQFIGELTNGMVVLDDITETVGSYNWRTLVREEPETGLQFKASFTVDSGRTYFLGSKNYSALDPVRYTILSTFTILH